MNDLIKYRLDWINSEVEGSPWGDEYISTNPEDEVDLLSEIEGTKKDIKDMQNNLKYLHKKLENILKEKK